MTLTPALGLTLAGVMTLCACAKPSPVDGAPACAPDTLRPLPSRSPLGQESLPARGLGQPWRLQAPGYVEVQLDDPAACVQVGAAALADGSVWIPEGRFGAFCADCVERTLTLVGGGLFALPAGSSVADMPIDFGLERRACDTLHRLPPDDASTLVAQLRVVGRTQAAPGERGILRVNLAVVGHDWARAGAQSDAVSRFIRALEAELADAGLRVDLHALCTLPSLSTDSSGLVVQAGETSAVERALEQVRADCAGFEPSEEDPRVTLLHLPCLRFRDPVLSSETPISGYVTHIPGGGAPDGVADAVLLAGACEFPPLLVDGVPVGLARRGAHEIGHYLGLFHSVEADPSVTDTLADTDADNLMNAVPALATARGLSPSQVAIVRAHPSVRFPLAGQEACAAPHM